MLHCGHKVYQVCSNDDRRLTFDLFTARSNFCLSLNICMGKILKNQFLKMYLKTKSYNV